MPATWVWKKCPQCGKRFEVYDGQWGYKLQERYFCSWHCLRSAEPGEEPKKGKSRTEKEAAINQMLSSGASTREIMRTLGIAKSTVSYYRARLVTEEDAI